MKKKLNSNLLPKNRLLPKQKYQWYFWDYIYYLGERARIKNGKYKMSGFSAIVAVITLVLSLIVGIMKGFWQLSLTFLAIYYLLSLFLFTIWYLRQYRKDRVKSMLIHYENSKWNEKISDALLMLIFITLCIVVAFIFNSNANM